MTADKITASLGKDTDHLRTHERRAAVINKRAGGAGLVTGKKAFQRTMKEGF
jgi:DhnA family fructose-bisphosphate aldolase class Ia